LPVITVSQILHHFRWPPQKRKIGVLLYSDKYQYFRGTYQLHLQGIIIVDVVYSSWAGHVADMGEERGAYRVLVGKPEGKRPLGRLRRRWVCNIRMDLQEVGCGYVDWIGLAQVVADACECGNEPSGSIKCGVFLE